MIRSRRLVSALAGTVLVGGVALAAPAGAGILAEGEPTVVSIEVELDLPIDNGSDGPIVYEVLDAPVVDGPELTSADLVDNPSDWCGSVTVDVDNVARTITVATEEACNFQTALVAVAGEGIGELTPISDSLWEDDEEDCTMGPAVLTTVDGGVLISWTSIPATEEDDGCSLNLEEGGEAVFSYTAVAPTTTTTSTSTTSTTVTTTTAAAQPAVVTPRFTG